MLRNIERMFTRFVGRKEGYPAHVLSIHESRTQNLAVQQVADGRLIAVDNRGVIALWLDGANPKAVDEVVRVKGEERQRRPLAATFPTEQLISFIDSDKIPASLHNIFLQADELASRTASLCFIRVPITVSAARELPSSMVSYTDEGDPVIQNWDPSGHDAVSSLIQKMYDTGIRYPAVTSMNRTGEPEIVDESEGIIFAQKYNIPLFLTDPQYNKSVKGSYTIFNVDQRGIQLVRDGNVPAALFSHVFGTDVDHTLARKPKYPQSNFPDVSSLPPDMARITIISHITGNATIR